MEKKQRAISSLIFNTLFFVPVLSQADILTTGEVFPAGLDTPGNASASFVNVGGNDVTPGVGTLEINSGSVLTTPAPEPFAAIGRLEGSDGSVTVTGSGSTWRIEGDDGTFGPFLNVGRGGVGVLNIINDGKVIIDGLGVEVGSNEGGGMWVGRQTTTPGSELNISGASSELRVENMDHTFFGVGRDFDATVNVTNGGSLIVDSNNDVISLRNGEMNINSGGLVLTEIFNVAATENDVFTVNLNGPTSRIHVTGVGDLSSGYGNASYGGFMTIGGREDAAAIVNVTNGAQINIDDGTGTAADGAVARGAGFSLGGNSVLGFGGQGVLNVDGDGSRVTVSTANNQGEFVGIGRTENGGGEVNLTNGGQIIVENNPGSDGVLMATNSDSGTAILSVDGEENGTPSMLDAGRFLGVGVTGDSSNTAEATVTVSGEGIVKADEIGVGSDGTIKGDGTLMGTIVSINPGGAVAPGLSPGTLTIDGNLELNGGVLEIEISGTDPGEFDVLNVINGSANLTDGTILFSFIDGFLPQADDPVIEFISASNGLTISPDVEFAFQGADESFQLAVSPNGTSLSFDALNDALPPEGVVLIDVKPRKKKNRINPRSRRGVWVAILSDDRPFDALQTNISTVRLGPDEASVVRHRVRDVNWDGQPDLLLRFKIRKTGIACGDTNVLLTGETWSGESISGTGSIKTVGCKCPYHHNHDEDEH